MRFDLSQLQVGQSATVCGIDGDTAYAQKLAMLGFTPGAIVAVVRNAPMGDPIQVRLRGYDLSLRRKEAAIVRLESVGEQ